MTQIALYDYLEQINRFLEDEQTTEAITHCRYVLRQYPRHVDTYRLLAKALLENREFGDAAELFRRILSADPNDFVAHVGLAEIYREAGELSEAVWHMERAFEMSPYDPAVYEVLRELYGQRDGEALTEIPLTRAALARLYFKGELYQEAATELQSILQQNGDDRVDLEVLLSETLWRDNQRVDAVAVALKVLEKLPDSIAVNAILGEVWLLTGRTEEAQRYLQHLLSLTQMDQKHLDLDSVVGQAFQTEGAPSLPKTVLVEQWRTAADADKFDAGTRVGTEQPIEDEAVYDWLREGGGTDMLEALADEEDESDWFTDRLEEPSDQEEAFAKTAEWLDSLGVEPESGDDFDFVADMPVVDEPETEGEMSSLVDESLVWPEEMVETTESEAFSHDWLEEMEDTVLESVEEEEEQADWFVSMLAEEADETEESDWFTAALENEDGAEEFDWFDEALTGDVAETTADSAVLHTADLLSQADEDDLDWLVEEDEAVVTPKESQELSELAEASFADESLAGDEEILPEWLMEIGESSESIDFGEPEPEDKISLFGGEADSVGTGDLFASDMVDGLEEEDELEFNTADLIANASEGLPDWLMEEQPQERTGGISDILGTTDLLSDTDLPDWLSEEDESDEKEPEERGSGLIGRMNRLMGTGELFADEDAEVEFEQEVEKPESEPLGLTGLLLGTAELMDEEESDDLFERDDETSEVDEPAEKGVGRVSPGLLGTAELLADLDTELPDWLQEDDQSDQKPQRSPLQTADLQGESLEEVPHWLSREEGTEEDEPKEEHPKPGARKSGVIGTAELFTSLGEDVPDWISETDEEEDDEEALAGEPSGLTGTTGLFSEWDDDVLDWARDEPQTVGWETPDSGESSIEMEDEAWLTDEMPMDETLADIVEEATPPTKSLLDWLAGESASTVDMEFDEADEEEAPDWLFSDTSQDEMEVVIMADSEQEDDLEEMPDDSDDMDWLEDLVAQDDAPDAGKRTPAEGEGDMPDWLSGLTEPATDSEAALSEADDVPLTLTDTDLPDWLKDLGETTAPATPTISSSMENLPDWLKPPPDLDLGLSEESDLPEPVEADAMADGMSDEGVDDLLDFDETDKSDKDNTSQIWLDALSADKDDFDLESGFITGVDEDLPDWLALSEEAETTAGTDAEADEDKAAFDFLADLDDEDGFSLDDLSDDLDFEQVEAEASDWLAALVEGDEEDLGETADEAGDFLDLLTEPDREGVLNFGEMEEVEEEAEEELPDWLMESADETVVAETADDLDLEALEDGEMDWLAALAEEGKAGTVEAADDEALPDWLSAVTADEVLDVEEEETEPEDDDVLELFAEVDTELFAFDETADADLDAEEMDEVPDWLMATAEASDDLSMEETAEDFAEDEVAELSDWLVASVIDDEDEDRAEVVTADETDEFALDDPMAWLDQLAAEQQEPVEDLPSVLDTSMYDMPEADKYADVSEEEEDEEALAEEWLATDEEDAAALAWLEGLDEDEAPEDEVDLTLAEMSVTDEEPALDWLDALDESESVLGEEVETAVPQEYDLETVKIHDDLEEAVAWLQELEAEEEEPFEELPTLDELLMEEAGEGAETADADEDEIDWLKELGAEDSEESVEELPTVAEVEVEPEPADPLQEALDRLEELALQDSALFITADPSDTDESVEMESLDEVLDWLEAQLAAPTADEAPEAVEDSLDSLEADSGEDELTLNVEMSTADEPVAFVDAVLDEEAAAPVEVEEETADEPLPEEMLGFFELEEGAEIEAFDVASDEMSDEMSDEDITAFMNAILDDEESFIPEKDVSFIPDDPNAVPSFAASIVEVEEEIVIEVEETADEQLLEELPDFAEELVEADEGDEMSDDDIMAFMDAIFDDDDSFIPEKDVSFTPDDPDALPSFAVAAPVTEEEPEETETDEFVDVLGELPTEESEEDVLAGMFDDVSDESDDIEAFMNAILDNEESFIPEKDVSFTPDDPDAVPSFATRQMADDEWDEADLGEVSDDPDMAIAWLQDLVDAQDDEAVGDEEDLDSFLPEIDEDFAVGLFADVAEGEETAGGQDAIEFDETLADSLPDWLEFGGEERLPGHTDWLRSLPEPDVAGWLEAEEEVMASNIFDEIPVPAEPDQPFSYTSGLEDEPLPEAEEEMLEEEIEAEAETTVSSFSLNTGTLNMARQSLAKGEYDQAMNQYRSLVEEGKGLSSLIADLETASEKYQQPLLRRLLGDAYMRNGQLQRALETYRVALDEL